MTSDDRSASQSPDEADTPAPVITDSGSYGRLPPAPAMDMSQFESSTVSARSGITWLAGLAFTLAAALWLATLSASQATDRTVALPAQEQGVAVLTSLDDLLRLHMAEITEATPTENGGVAVPGFLTPGIELTAAEAASGDRALMRAALLERAGLAIYEQGIEALQVPDGPPIETSTFSTPGGTRRVMDGLTQANHDRATNLLRPLAIAALILGGIVVLLGNGFSRFTALGLAMVGAAGLVFLGALLLQFAIAFVGSDGTAVADEYSRLIDAIAWTPARNAITFGVAGAAVLVPAWLLNWFFDRSLVRPAPVIDGRSA